MQGQEITLLLPSTTSFWAYTCELLECFREAWIFQGTSGDPVDMLMNFSYVCVYKCVYESISMYVFACVFVHMCLRVCL